LSEIDWCCCCPTKKLKADCNTTDATFGSTDPVSVRPTLQRNDSQGTFVATLTQCCGATGCTQENDCDAPKPCGGT
jgi:hypothetical protein